MIGELEESHGVVLARLVRNGPGFSIASRGRSAYVVGGRVGMYVKYSTSRLTPWSFSFSRAQQLEVQALADEFAEVFVVLVCGRDGMACLRSDELARVLDHSFEETEWVKASRRARERYLITGTNGRRGFKVADSDFPGKLAAALALVAPS